MQTRTIETCENRSQQYCKPEYCKHCYRNERDKKKKAANMEQAARNGRSVSHRTRLADADGISGKGSIG